MLSITKIMIPKSLPSIQLLLLFLLSMLIKSQARCKAGCEVAIGAYTIWEGSNLTYISHLFSQNIPQILLYNPSVPNQDSILTDSILNIPFSCDCLNGDFLAHTFTYQTQSGDTYDKIAKFAFANLTTEDWVHRVNVYHPTRIPEHVPINVTVNCSCGDKRVSKRYGLFATYPLRSGDNLLSLAADSGVASDLLQRYNPSLDFSAGIGIAFVPAKG